MNRTRYWRTLAEAETGGEEASHGNVVAPARPLSRTRIEDARWSHRTDVAVAPHGRRDFMKAMAASLALAGGGCSRPPLEAIVPYHDGPPQQTYGKPVFYASTLARDGYGFGVLVETNMGCPTKIEGNPLHPASLGATDVFAQAAVLELWDPDRSQFVRDGRTGATWNRFLLALGERLRALEGRGGAGVAVLTESVTSPSLAAGIGAVLARFPGARWYQWQPQNRDNAVAGATLAYGTALETVEHYDRARIVLALDGDFLDEHPRMVRHALDVATTRNALAPPSARSRIYALECTPSLTGANADHRLALRATEIDDAAREIAHALGIVRTPPQRTVVPAAWLRSLVDDLHRHRGASIVTAGHRQPPAVHALVHAINAALGNVGSTIALIASPLAHPARHLDALRELVLAMREGAVDTLIVSGANPVYTAPADLRFAEALAQVPFSVHHGLYVDETAGACSWHVPAAHSLETWGDLRAFDGTLSFQQPCIAPLFDGRSAHELVAALAGDAASTTRALVEAYWKQTDSSAFGDDALRRGVVADAAAAPAASPPAIASDIDAVLERSGAARAASSLDLVFVPDPRIGDGRHANNAWLQELPKPLSQLTWDNAALVSPALAQALGLRSDDVVAVRVAERRIEAPVFVMPGMPDRSVTLALGYGRRSAGRVGNDVGVDAYRLRTSDAAWIVADASLEATGRRHALATAQTHHTMEGRDIVRAYTLAEAENCRPSVCGTPGHRGAPTLYDSPPQGPLAWAMSIDLSACIGCGACTIACQAENNIPVVGRDEVRNGREMHWIRVDRYYEGRVDDPRTVFQPVPCMQCEHAPCEVVCPVEASVHDAQGINVQVYNRCVGTRFCSNNCPYKVRRFNFFAYAEDAPALAAQRNPDVTVRMRGVMEKCNYCLQRITTARIEADREGRGLRDGDVITACQAACPTRAIVFGDLNDAASEVNARKRSPLDYALLAELNTRPRTTYLARVTNPSPALARPAPQRAGGEAATPPGPASATDVVTQARNGD